MKKRMNKKLILVLSICLLLVVLTACGGCRHEWQNATCTEAKTCVKCGETKGEALGHVLADDGSEFCAVCGEFAEDLVEIVADFEKYDIPINMTLGENYAMDYPCYGDEGKNYFNRVMLRITEAGEIDKIKDYDKFKACEAVGEDILADKEGYKWYVISWSSRMESNENVSKYGFYYPSIHDEDYYNIAFHDDTAEHTQVNDHIQYKQFSCKWKGREYTDCVQISRDTASYWQYAESNPRQFIFGETYLYRIPEGYDGVVFGFHPRALSENWKSGMYFYDLAGDYETLNFRLIP